MAEIGEAIRVEVHEPVVGHRLQIRGGHHLRRHEVHLPETKVILRIEGRVTDEQREARGFPPGASRPLEEVPDRIRCPLPEGELVVDVRHVDERDGETLRTAQRQQRFHCGEHRRVGDHDEVRAVVPCVQRGGLIRNHILGG